MPATPEHLLPWLAIMYWQDTPATIRMNSYDIELAIWLMED